MAKKGSEAQQIDSLIRNIGLNKTASLGASRALLKNSIEAAAAATVPENSEAAARSQQQLEFEPEILGSQLRPDRPRKIKIER